jgi:hypothetical protein
MERAERRRERFRRTGQDRTGAGPGSTASSHPVTVSRREAASSVGGTLKAQPIDRAKGLAQPRDHFNGIHEVMGSSPISSTNSDNNLQR